MKVTFCAKMGKLGFKIEMLDAYLLALSIAFSAIKSSSPLSFVLSALASTVLLVNSHFLHAPIHLPSTIFAIILLPLPIYSSVLLPLVSSFFLYLSSVPFLVFDSVFISFIFLLCLHYCLLRPLSKRRENRRRVTPIRL